MKGLTILTFLIFSTTVVISQDRYYGGYADFDGAPRIDINQAKDLPVIIQNKLDSIFENAFMVYSKCLKFRAARKPDLNFEYKTYYEDLGAPYYQILYSLDIPNVIDQETDSIVEDGGNGYRILISMDSLGNVINPIYLPSKKWQSKEILTKENVINISKKLWLNQKEELHVSLEFDTKQKCFVWFLSRQIEGPSKKGIHGREQLIIINAYTKKIISNTKYYLNSNFI